MGKSPEKIVHFLYVPISCTIEMMRSKLIFAVLLICAFVSTFQSLSAQSAPSFLKRLPPTCPLSSVVSVTNGYLGVGACAGPSGLAQPFAFKLNSSGKVMWQKEYRFVGNDGGSFERAIETNSGHLILFGKRNDAVTFDSDPLIVKVTSSGIPVWKKVITAESGDFLNTAVEAMDGNYLFAGKTESFASSAASEGWIVKISVSGELIFSRAYRRTNSLDGEFRGIIQISDGFLFVGSTDFFTNGPSRALVLKTDLAGNVKWGRTYYKPNGWLQVFSASATQDRGAFIVGEFGGLDFGENLDAIVFRINSNGIIQWKRRYGTPKLDGALSVTTAVDGDVLVAGYTESPEFPGTNGLILRLNERGVVEWKKVFGGVSADQLEFVSGTVENGLIATGLYGALYPVIIKLNSDGLLNGCHFVADAALQQSNPPIIVSLAPIQNHSISHGIETPNMNVISANRILSDLCRN